MHNKSIKIQYEVKDDFSLNKLIFQLADHKGNIFYNIDKTPVSNLSWNGQTTVFADDILDENNQQVTEKKYLQLISIVTDKAGNEKIRSHGWLVWWPEADKPWITGAGHESDPQIFKVYPGSEVQAQAYDNDGVASVSYKIYLKSSGALISEDTLNNVPLNENTAPSMFFSWNFRVPSVCNEYFIEIDCRDIYNTSGTGTYYFYVYDINAPGIDIITPEPDISLFGSNSGTFTISGIAGDGVNPVKLTLVWLNPKGDSENRFLYQSSEYEGWEIISETSYGTDLSGDNFWKDTEGNLIWELELDEGTFNETTKRMNRPFSKDINLFADLNIGSGGGKISLTSQLFILRVEGAAGRALTVLHSVRGDITPPSLTIEKVAVYRNSALHKEYTVTGNILDEGQMDAMETDDELYISGTWGDDSYDVWQNSNYMGAFTVSWNELKAPDNGSGSYAELNVPSAGYWKAGPLVINNEQKQKGSGRIEAALQDLGGNKTIKTFSARVDTNVPRLMFISSENEDGAYKAVDEIIIYLEFNKAVEFEGVGTPELKLNNNKTAVYTTGNGTAKHEFKYTVAPNDDINMLDVSEVLFDGTWTGSGGMADITFNGINLKDNKNIAIDTVVPEILKIEALSGLSGEINYYSSGKTIYLLITFNEEISFKPGSGNTTALTLNSGGQGEDPVMSGQRSLLFTYRVTGSGDNTPFTPPDDWTFLTAESLILAGDAEITDIAGNVFTGGSIPGEAANIEQNGKDIVIDTTPPDAPVLSTAAVNGNTYTTPQTFTLDGEERAKLEYRISGTGSWLPYSNTVTLTSAMTYNITARQIDLAGNISQTSVPITFTIEITNPLLKSFGGSTPGTYVTDQIVEVTLNLREAVIVNTSGGSPSLLLNVEKSSSADAVALFDSASSGTNKLVFKYTVQEGDYAEILEIKEINLNGAILTRPGTGEGLTSQLTKLTGWDTDPQGLSFYTRIEIRTDTPVFENAELNAAGTGLILNFNKNIFKGTGNIVITQLGDYLAPAVLTKSEYQRFGGDSALEDYYAAGANGADASGKPDLTEKYVLKYDIETDDEDLIEAIIISGEELETNTSLAGSYANIVIVPVVSGAVTIGSNKTSLVVDISENYGYILRVKGVEYSVTFKEGLVQDSQSNKTAACTVIDADNTFLNPGVNEPVIRLQKEKEKIVMSGTVLSPNVSIAGAGTSTTVTVTNNSDQTFASQLTAVQPLTANVKIDCQTPGSKIYYKVINKETLPFAGSFNNGDHEQPAIIMPTEVDVTLSDGTKLYTTTGPFTLGEYNLNGYLYGIMAESQKTIDAETYTSQAAYERAARSVIMFRDIRDLAYWGNLCGASPNTLQLWIRGGDNLSGASLTPGFPLSWSDKDYGGIRLLTRPGSDTANNTGTWYWVTWEVNTAAFFHFIAGSTNNDITDIQNNGPLEWCWAKSSYAFQHSDYPLYPGGSLVFSRYTEVPSPSPADIEFYPNFSGGRP